MKALITGGAGFIGSNLALELEKEGNDVTVIDNLSSGNSKNLKDFKGNFIEMDVLKLNLKYNFDVVFHQASVTDTTFKDDTEMLRQNINGFLEVIKFAKNKNAKLIYASSAGVYGNGKTPMKEDQKKQTLNAYAYSKCVMDGVAEKLFDKMFIIGLRYFNVFGPREAHKGRPASMVYHLANQIKAGKNPRIFKMGEQKRDHIYIKDAVLATIKAINAKSNIYNVGTGIATTFNELVKTLNEVLNTNLEPEYFDNPYEGTYQNNTQADTQRAEKELNFKAEYSLKQGIKEYMEFLGYK